MEQRDERNGSPQLEDGYTRLANELWRAWMCCPLTSREERLLKAIVRFSYGVGKKHALLSRAELSLYTSIALPHVGGALKSLLSKNIIGMEKSANAGSFKVWVNKHYLEWKVEGGIKNIDGTESQFNQTLAKCLADSELTHSATRLYQPGNPTVEATTNLVTPLYQPGNPTGGGITDSVTPLYQPGNPVVTNLVEKSYQLGIREIDQNTEIIYENTSLKKVKEIYKENIKENKEREKKREKVREGEKPPPSRRTLKKFKIPSLQEVTAYCEERKNTINPQTFVDYYTSNGWMVGRTRMKDWKAAIRTWEQRRKDGHANRTAALTGSETYRDEDGCLRDAGGYPIDVEIHE